MSKQGRLSYASTPSTEPYLYKTVLDRLRELAIQNPNKEAFVYYNKNKERTWVTRRDLLERTESAAKRLLHVGVQKNVNVMFCMSNSLEMLIMNLAVVMAGGVPFFFSANMKDGSDLIEFINDLGGYMLIIDTNQGDDNWQFINRIWPSNDDTSKLSPSLKMILCNGVSVKEDSHRKKLSSFLEERVENDVEFPQVQPEDILAYFCSSGSTGKPKEVVYTHFGMLNWTKMSNDRFGLTEESRFFCERTFGWVVGYPRTYLSEGACRVLVETSFSTGSQYTEFLCDVIQNEQCDCIYLPGYIIADLLKKRELATKLKDVKSVIVSGERILAETFSALKELFCSNICVWYGNTEAGGAAVYGECNMFEDGLIGKPLKGVELKVVDEFGKTTQVGTQGELCIRCSWRFSGYRNMNDQFRQAVDNSSWFHTGDIAHMREDGNFVVDGRFKEMISMATLKYFPWPIERALKNIEGVQQIFAVGVPDPRLHQVPCVCVIPKPNSTITEADVKKYCDEIFLESSTTTGFSLKPRYCVFLDKVPLTPSGKIDRRTVGLIAKEKLRL